MSADGNKFIRVSGILYLKGTFLLFRAQAAGHYQANMKNRKNLGNR